MEDKLDEKVVEEIWWTCIVGLILFSLKIIHANARYMIYKFIHCNETRWDIVLLSYCRSEY
jgi:hypothetical protein